MSKLLYASTALVFALSASVASAQTAQPLPPAAAPGPAARVLPSVPSEAMTVTRWHKQNVYDPSDAKIGEIEDVLVDRDGKIIAFIVAVGGFLGMGEKDVAVPFNAVQFKTKDNNKFYPVMAGVAASGEKGVLAIMEGTTSDRVSCGTTGRLEQLIRQRLLDKLSVSDQ